MIGRTNAGGGAGGGLNFRVLGGTTQPTNLRENDIWVNTDTAISSWDFSATEPQRRSNNKNLIVHPYDNPKQTVAGITFNPYTGGTVGASGTASENATYFLNDKNPLVLPAGTYTFSGAMEGGGTDTWVVGLKYSYDDFKTPVYSTTGTYKTITFDKPVKVMVYLQVKSGATPSGNFRPQLEKGAAATAFLKGDATGQVWISTGAFSSALFNALKKNNITVYPLSAKQYVSGAWVDKTAKSYQNGSWVDWWNGELFINGNQYDAFTGGWVRADYYKGNDDNTNTGTLTVDDTIYLKTSTGTYCKSVRTSNKIDLTNWKTLKYTVTKYNKGEAAILVTSQVGDVDNVSVAMGTFAVGENSLDIKELTGEYYIGAYVRNAGEVTIEKIYLEA